MKFELLSLFAFELSIKLISDECCQLPVEPKVKHSVSFPGVGEFNFSV